MQTETRQKLEPIVRAKEGRFQVSLWRVPKLRANGSRDSTAYTERVEEVDRACIQRSVWDYRTQEFINKQIWCSAEEIRDLANAIERLQKGEDDSSLSS